MANYQFVTHWRFDAPISRVWDEIYHSERWPSWWRAVLAVTKVKSGDGKSIGAIHRYTWRGALPYKLTFEMRTSRIEEPTLLEGHATGELTGHGCWRLSSEGGTTVVRYDWEVETTKWWMRLLTPIARPLFEWNHDTVMRWGFESLKKRLESSQTSSPPSSYNT